MVSRVPANVDSQHENASDDEMDVDGNSAEVSHVESEAGTTATNTPDQIKLTTDEDNSSSGKADFFTDPEVSVNT